jgi:hypothetical protein
VPRESAQKTIFKIPHTKRISRNSPVAQEPALARRPLPHGWRAYEGREKGRAKGKRPGRWVQRSSAAHRPLAGPAAVSRPKKRFLKSPIQNEFLGIRQLRKSPPWRAAQRTPTGGHMRGRDKVPGPAGGLSGSTWAPPRGDLQDGSHSFSSIPCVQLLRGSLRFAGVSTVAARATSGPHPAFRASARFRVGIWDDC